jgi:hypothetical protein
VSSNPIGQTKKQQRAISRAFDGACEELGIGMLGLDVWKREQLAQLILCLVDDQGELDSDALQRRAVIKFLSANAENSSTTTGIAVKDA